MHKIQVAKCCGVGRVKNLNSIQVLFSCYAIEREFDLDAWKGMWNEVNNSTCGHLHAQPLLNR